MLTLWQLLLKVRQNGPLVLLDQFRRELGEDLEKREIPRPRLPIETLQRKVNAAHVQIAHGIARAERVEAECEGETTGQFLEILNKL